MPSVTFMHVSGDFLQARHHTVFTRSPERWVKVGDYQSRSLVVPLLLQSKGVEGDVLVTAEILIKHSRPDSWSLNRRMQTFSGVKVRQCISSRFRWDKNSFEINGYVWLLGWIRPACVLWRAQFLSEACTGFCSLRRSPDAMLLFLRFSSRFNNPLSASLCCRLEAFFPSSFLPL